MNKQLNTNGLNPILPLNIYIADGEPKVFGDRVYLYGSHDLFDGGYCSYDYHVYSAPVNDLTSWTDHGVCFESRRGDNTADVPWSCELLWAPDVIKFGGKYYLYFCLADGSEGVAESETPYGNFTNARRITMNGEPIKGIDPSVLVDNGRIYYTWGQGEMRMGELEADMCSIKPESYHNAVITHHLGGEGFHEGSSLRKIGDKYCIIYASEWTEAYPNCGGKPTKLDYAVSDNVYGPYKRMGTVINNEGIDPQSWNNHGSVIKIENQWYVFYHASSNNSKYSRRARVERLTVDEVNGIITEAKISSNGFLECIETEDLTQPANACRFTYGAYVTERKDGTHPLVNVYNDGGMIFDSVHFEAGKYIFSVNYTAFEKSVLKLYIGNELVAEVEFETDKSTVSAELSVKEYTGNVYMKICGDGGKELCNIIDFCFNLR